MIDIFDHDHDHDHGKKSVPDHDHDHDHEKKSFFIHDHKVHKYLVRVTMFLITEFFNIYLTFFSQQSIIHKTKGATGIYFTEIYWIYLISLI